MKSHKVTDKSKENLKPFTQNSEKSREAQKKSVIKRLENKAAKIKRNEAKDWTWDEYGQQLVQDIAECGSIKEKVELLKAILPPDKQIQELNGSLGVEKVFITPEDVKAIDNHIDKVINS